LSDFNRVDVISFKNLNCNNMSKFYFKIVVIDAKEWKGMQSKIVSYIVDHPTFRLLLLSSEATSRLSSLFQVVLLTVECYCSSIPSQSILDQEWDVRRGFIGPSITSFGFKSTSSDLKMPSKGLWIYFCAILGFLIFENPLFRLVLYVRCWESVTFEETYT